ncbi:MAG: PEFG-CTERM sorting domain-containing protein [Nitrosopumilus sp.]|nr:PEFG-CTERM sorting domain-containing protein [Nitrosopumilus sp.]
MNFKRSTTSMAIALMAMALISVTSIQQDVFAQSQGMAITATADKGSDTITVIGKTVSQVTDVTFRVISPSGNNVVIVDQISPDDNGNFVAEFKIGPTWTEDGFYTIMAMQGIQQNSLYTMEVVVEIIDQMTERTSVTESNLETGSFMSDEPNAAKDTGLEIYADAVIGSTIIEITGWTDRVSQDITLTVTAPNGNVVSVDQISPKLNGEFISVITTGGPLWKQDGIYTVEARQFDDPKYSVSAEVDIKDGAVIPEFGTIAAMILAVAIISIIAVSARSRLSIMPRY